MSAIRELHTATINVLKIIDTSFQWKNGTPRSRYVIVSNCGKFIVRASKAQNWSKLCIQPGDTCMIKYYVKKVGKNRKVKQLYLTSIAKLVDI